MNFSEACDYIANIPRFTKKNTPEATRAFLEYIGDFSNEIPTIHVAGTNGKGSVCAYLRAALMEEGLRVGTFTSPHLVDIRERFAIDNDMISREDFADSFNCVMDSLESFKTQKQFSEYHPTFFEMLFFMAAVYYNRVKPDVVVLETGLGGRLDATNSISSPKVCVITEIGMDHCEYLGDTPSKIAGEKAGIIKPGVPVVHFSKGTDYTKVIEDRALLLNSEAFKVSHANIKNFKTNSKGIDFYIDSLYDNSVKISLYTRAFYQADNALIAYRTLEVFSKVCNRPINVECFLSGFAKMVWPGRMELVSDDLVLDGAHNEDGILAFIDSVSGDGFIRRSLLFSQVSDKEVEKISLKLINSNLFDRIYVCGLSSYRASSMERLKLAFETAKGVKVSFHDSVTEGFMKMRSEREAGRMQYVAGSLYLVGEVKELL